MKWLYIISPFIGYLTAGTLKFIINSLKAKKLNFAAIGLGGMPSTHTTIISTLATTLALTNGIDSATFAISVAILLIVIIDALDLRNKVGKHAIILKNQFPNIEATQNLREKCGHTIYEIMGGIITGIVCGSLLYAFSMVNG